MNVASNVINVALAQRGGNHVTQSLKDASAFEGTDLYFDFNSVQCASNRSKHSLYTVERTVWKSLKMHNFHVAPVKYALEICRMRQVLPPTTISARQAHVAVRLEQFMGITVAGPMGFRVRVEWSTGTVGD
jgi:hypothetical protein